MPCDAANTARHNAAVAMPASTLRISPNNKSDGCKKFNFFNKSDAHNKDDAWKNHLCLSFKFSFNKMI